MSSILDIDLDYFNLLENPEKRLTYFFFIIRSFCFRPGRKNTLAISYIISKSINPFSKIFKDFFKTYFYPDILFYYY